MLVRRRRDELAPFYWIDSNVDVRPRARVAARMNDSFVVVGACHDGKGRQWRHPSRRADDPSMRCELAHAERAQSSLVQFET